MDVDIGDVLDLDDNNDDETTDEEEEEDDKSTDYESAEDDVIEIKTVQKFDDNDRKCASFVNKIQLDTKENVKSDDFVELVGGEDYDPAETESVVSYSGFSCFSHSTTSTIHPDVIKHRVKTDLVKQQKKQSRMSKVKGEASAVTRSRRNN